MSSIENFLTQSDTYLKLFDGYYEKLAKSSRFNHQHPIHQWDKTHLAKEIAEEISTGSFQFEPAKQRRLIISSRKKKLYTFNTKDLLVLKAMQTVLQPLIRSRCSSKVYSYLKYRNFKQPINHFLDYRQQLAKAKTGPCELFLYRTDIKHFFEEIPTHGRSKLWSMLDDLLPSDLNPKLKSLYYDAIRPVYESLEGNLTQNAIGIPYGSPLSALISNLYLSEIDAKFSAVPDLFYARYSDDILIAHPDQQTLLQMEQELRDEIHQHDLTITKEKEKRLYLNQAGRAAQDLQFKGSSTFSYLGFIIHANGKLQGSQRRTQRFMSLCKQLIDQAAADSKDQAYQKRGLFICHQLKSALFTNENAYKRTQEIILRTNDLNYLKQLDLRIAQWIAEALTGLRGSSALRGNFYWTLRNAWHLPSLVKLRNQFH